MSEFPPDIRAAAAQYVLHSTNDTLRKCATLFSVRDFDVMSEINPLRSPGMCDRQRCEAIFKQIPDLSFNPHCGERNIQIGGPEVSWLVQHWFDDIIRACGTKLRIEDLKVRSLVPDSRGFFHASRGPCLCILHPSWFPLVIAATKKLDVVAKSSRGRGQGHVFSALGSTSTDVSCKWCWYAREDSDGSGSLSRYAKRPMLSVKVGALPLGDKVPMRLLFEDRADFEASHLCHNPICVNAGHVVSESHWNNAARNGCCGLTRCMCSPSGRWICWRPGPYRAKAMVDGEDETAGLSVS
jgi:hypothetical protein